MEPSTEVKSRIKKLLAEVVADPSLAERVTDGSDLINEVGLDSIQIINFVLMLEDEFQLEIDFENFSYARFERFGSFCEFVTEALQVRAQA